MTKCMMPNCPVCDGVTQENAMSDTDETLKKIIPHTEQEEVLKRRQWALGLDELEHRFFYHQPSPGGVARHRALSVQFTQLADQVDTICPPGREKSLAFTKLEEAKFWASAAVARNPETR